MGAAPAIAHEHRLRGEIGLLSSDDATRAEDCFRTALAIVIEQESKQ